MVIPTGFGQANFRYAGSAIPLGAQWTLGLNVTGWAGSVTDAAEALWLAHNSADLPSVIGSGCDLVAVDVKFGPGDVGPSGSWNETSPSDGGIPSDSPGTSVLVHKQTPFGGRAGRGRLYLPCAPDAGIAAAGRLESTFQGQVQTRFDDLLAQMNTLDLPPVLLHSSLIPFPAPTLITSFRVDPQVGTQRRRNRR